MNRLTFSLFFLVLSVAARPGLAEREQVIDGNRIQLGDIVPNLSPMPAALDLGPAPKAGGSRLLSKQEISRALKDAGASAAVTDSVRVVRGTKRWTQQNLITWVSPAVQAALPNNATLVQVQAPRTYLTPTNAVVGNIELGQLPRRRGTLHTTAIVDINVDGRLDQRLTLPLVLELAEPQRPVTVPRGQSVTLSISLGQTRVSAIATTMQTAEVGDHTLCRVSRTKKVLRARLLTANTAEVVVE